MNQLHIYIYLLFFRFPSHLGHHRRRQWHPTPVLLPGKFHGQRSLVGCSPWGHYESDTTERLHFHFSLSCIGEGNGNPLQCSCLENPRDGGAWWAARYGLAQSRTRLKWLSSRSPQSTEQRSLWYTVGSPCVWVVLSHAWLYATHGLQPIRLFCGIFQARILERVAISCSRYSQPRDQTQVSCTSCVGTRVLSYCATYEARFSLVFYFIRSINSV